MRKSTIAFIASVLTLALAGGVSAQSRPSSEGKTSPTDDSQRQAWSPSSNAVETSKLIGTKVQTIDGKEIGSIDQLIVNPRDGKVTHVVLGRGGVLGMGQTKLVLRWADLKLQRDPDQADRVMAVVDQAKLDAAPRYEARKASETTPAASPTTTPNRKSEPAKKY
jgi:sporulation protein YlmC with PRC-barrel domain